MGLLDLFNQWIVERGSAAVQERHLSMFRDQLAMTDKKISMLESENAALKTENDKFKAEVENLRIATNELTAKIKTYEYPTHDILLEEIQITILKLLFSTEKLTTEQIAASLNIQLQTAKYHLEELANLHMVSLQSFSEQVPGYGPFHPNALRRYSAWLIRQPGRKFLIANGYVS